MSESKHEFNAIVGAEKDQSICQPREKLIGVKVRAMMKMWTSVL